MSGPRVPRLVLEVSTSRRRFLQTIAVGVGATTLLGRSAGTVLAGQIGPESLPGHLPTALVNDEMSRCHVPPGHRPECPQRYDAVLGALKKSDYFSTLKPYQPRAATDDEITACHSREYLMRVRREIESAPTG